MRDLCNTATHIVYAPCVIVSWQGVVCDNAAVPFQCSWTARIIASWPLDCSKCHRLALGFSQGVCGVAQSLHYITDRRGWRGVFIWQCLAPDGECLSRLHEVPREPIVGLR